MNQLIFVDEDEATFTPNMGCVPERWRNASFDTFDFAGRETLKDVIAEYLSAFDYGGCDSLLLHPDDRAHELFICLYRAIASRVSADAYHFLDWAAIIPNARTQAVLLHDLVSVRFLFVLNAAAPTNAHRDVLAALFNYCHSSRIRLFMATHLQATDLPQGLFPEQFHDMYFEKVLRIGFHAHAK